MKCVTEKRMLIMIIFVMMLLFSGCQSKVSGDEPENVTSGEAMTEQSTEETAAKEQETDPTKEMLGLVGSVAESVRAELDYELAADDIEAITEMLRSVETDRRVSDYFRLPQNQVWEPGSYSFRVYVDVSDETLFSHRKRPIYYVWAESRQDLNSVYGDSEAGFCNSITKGYWWYLSGNHINLDDYSDSELILLYEGEYVVEDTTKKIGYDFPEKKEILTNLWLYALEMFYDDYQDHERFYLSTCISDFTNYNPQEIFINLNYNWSIIEGGYYFMLDDSGEMKKLKMSYAMGGEYNYSEESFLKYSENSAIIVKGTITKDWNDDFRNTELIPRYEDKMNGVCGAVMGAIAGKHLEQTGSITGDIQAECYLTEINKNSSRGEGWIILDGQEPVKVTVDYDYSGRWEFSSYDYSIDENSVADGNFAEEYVLKMTVDLTTECPYFETEKKDDFANVFTGNLEEMNLHQGYLDELTQNRYLTADYDGDGLVDRFYYANDVNGELCLCFGNGDRLSMGKPLNGLYWGLVRCGDVTGDGVEEIIYNNWIPGTRERIDCFGIWQKTDDGWTRIPIKTGDDVEALKKVGQFEDIHIRVERLDNEQLKITQLDIGNTKLLDIGSVAMEYVWPSEEVQSVDTSVRVSNIELKQGDDNGRWRIEAALRIGKADLIGQLMYEAGQWVIQNWNMTIAE